MVRAPPACDRLSASGVPARPPAQSPQRQRSVVFLMGEHGRGKGGGLPTLLGVRSIQTSPVRLTFTPRPRSRVATNFPSLAPFAKSSLRWARVALTSTCSKADVCTYRLEPVSEIWLSSVSARTRVHLLCSLGYGPAPPRVPARFAQLWNLGAVACPRPACPSSGCPHFLLCWVHEMPQAHLVFFSARPSHEPFLREPWFTWVMLTLGNAAQVFGNRARLAGGLSSCPHCPAPIPGHGDTRDTRLPSRGFPIRLRKP